jgi:alpha-glucosidase (family GH31 glycosyl hydrolase)
VSSVTAVQGGFEAPPDERFVGLGERFDSVNQRGRTVDVWAEDRRVAGYGPSTYAPIPLLMSSRGYAFALERFERSRFDLAATRPDRWTWEQDAPTASILLTYGPGLKDLVSRNAELVGLPLLPPPWLFGVWKTLVGGQA